MESMKQRWTYLCSLSSQNFQPWPRGKCSFGFQLVLPWPQVSLLVRVLVGANGVLACQFRTRLRGLYGRSWHRKPWGNRTLKTLIFQAPETESFETYLFSETPPVPRSSIQTSYAEAAQAAQVCSYRHPSRGIPKHHLGPKGNIPWCHPRPSALWWTTSSRSSHGPSQRPEALHPGSKPCSQYLV